MKYLKGYNQEGNEYRLIPVKDGYAWYEQSTDYFGNIYFRYLHWIADCMTDGLELTKVEIES